MLGPRAVLVSTASTFLFLAAIAVAITLAPGSAIVGERFFNWEHIRDSFVGTTSTPSVVEAFWLNIRMFTVAEIAILLVAMVIAIVRGIPFAHSRLRTRTCFGGSP